MPRRAITPLMAWSMSARRAGSKACCGGADAQAAIRLETEASINPRRKVERIFTRQGSTAAYCSRADAIAGYCAMIDCNSVNGCVKFPAPSLAARTPCCHENHPDLRRLPDADGLR